MSPPDGCIYTASTLQPCLAIEPEPDSGIRVGLDQRYAALTELLPLTGGGAMRLGEDGELILARRLRTMLPWMEPAIAAVERQVRVSLWAGRPWLAWNPICLVGDPGSGKSHFARTLAAEAGMPCAALDLGAMFDAAALTSVSRGWTNTKPCWPAQMMAAFRTANPVLVLDEIEKAGGSERAGEPHKALLGMLEPATAARYFDTCLMSEVDLSAVCWVATANSVDRLPGSLRSRLEVIPVTGPNPEHFGSVLGSLLVALAGEWQLPPDSLPELPERATGILRRGFERHRSVRLLRRHLQAVLAALFHSAGRSLH